MQDNQTPTATVVAVARDAEHRFSKQTVPEIRILEGLGVEGDAHIGTTVQHRSRIAAHGEDPNLRQVHLIASELLDELTDQGFQVAPAALGENITTGGIDFLSLPRGTRLAIGETVVLQLTGLRNPCWQIDRFAPGLLAAVSLREPGRKVALKGGVMTVAVVGGTVRPGDPIRVELPPEPHHQMENV